MCGPIRPLTAIECIRLRPGMYVGDVDETGLHQLALFLLLDMFESTPPPTRVSVFVDRDALIITDDRRVSAPDPMLMRWLAEELSTLKDAGVVHAGGMHGCLETTITNALSREFEFEVWSDGVGLRSVYERGQLRSGPLPFTPASEHGVWVRFTADETLFSKTAWNVGWLAEQLQALGGRYGTQGEVRDLSRSRMSEAHRDDRPSALRA